MHTHDGPAEGPAIRDGAPDDPITVAVRSAGEHRVVVEVGGEIDMLTTPRLRSAALDLIGAGPELIVLDLDGVSFLGTSGLATLIEIREAAHREGVEFRIACSGRRVLRPIAIAGLEPMFDIHPTVEAALQDT